MKKYKVEFTMKIIEGHGEPFDPNTPVSISIKENVTPGESPIKLIATRIAQELKRIESKTSLEWEDEEKDPADVINEMGE